MVSPRPMKPPADYTPLPFLTAFFDGPSMAPLPFIVHLPPFGVEMRYQLKSLAMTSLALFSLLVVSTPAAFAEGGILGARRQHPIFTHHTLQKAWQAAVSRRRPMLVLFSTDGCHFCTKMMAETYSQPEVQRMLHGHVEGVKVNAQKNPDVVARLGIRGYPTTLLVSPEGNVMDAIEGFASAKTFTSRIGPLLKNTGYSASAKAANARTARSDRGGS